MKTLLGFDFGLKRVGVAVGNTKFRQAQPLTIINFTNKKSGFIEIHKLIIEWEPSYCIIGLPFYLNDNLNHMTKKCKHFANQISTYFNLDVILVDERYSSIVISTTLYKKSNDAIAAAIILQQYFDEQKHKFHIKISLNIHKVNFLNIQK